MECIRQYYNYQMHMEKVFMTSSQLSSRSRSHIKDRFIKRDSQNYLQWQLLSHHDENDHQYQKFLRQNIKNPHSNKLVNQYTDVHENFDKFDYQFDDIDRVGPKKIKSQIFAKSIAAPGLRDDFYLNLIDWSPEGLIAIGNGRRIYTISRGYSILTCLYQGDDKNNPVCSVGFNQSGKIGLGDSQGNLRIIDIQKKITQTNIHSHYGRIGSLNWNLNCVATGSREGTVSIYDNRSKKRISFYSSHKRQICGLKWIESGQYIATGGNDTKLAIFDTRKSEELTIFQSHKAAVKAIDWCPYQRGIIASGGGTIDRNIKIFDINNLTEKYSLDTGTQICNLAFSKISKQLVTTHGYSMNQINVWGIKSNWQHLEHTRMLRGHKMRVLYLAKSPKGNSILTGAGDETIKIWNVFEGQKPQGKFQSMTDLR